MTHRPHHCLARLGLLAMATVVAVTLGACNRGPSTLDVHNRTSVPIAWEDYDVVNVVAPCSVAHFANSAADKVADGGYWWPVDPPGRPSPEPSDAVRVRLSYYPPADAVDHFTIVISDGKVMRTGPDPTLPACGGLPPARVVVQNDSGNAVLIRIGTTTWAIGSGEIATLKPVELATAEVGTARWYEVIDAASCTTREPILVDFGRPFNAYIVIPAKGPTNALPGQAGPPVPVQPDRRPRDSQPIAGPCTTALP